MLTSLVWSLWDRETQPPKKTTSLKSEGATSFYPSLSWVPFWDCWTDCSVLSFRPFYCLNKQRRHRRSRCQSSVASVCGRCPFDVRAPACSPLKWWAWALGCVNSRPAARGTQEARFTKPRAILMAHLCTATVGSESFPTRSGEAVSFGGRRRSHTHACPERIWGQWETDLGILVLGLMNSIPFILLSPP